MPSPDGAGGRRAEITAQTLDRGLQILSRLAAAPEGMLSSDLAAALGLHRTIIYRLLNTLAAHRLVTQGPTGRYRLGSGLVVLAQGVSSDLRGVAQPELAALAEEAGATACLTIAEGEEGVAVLSVEPRRTPIHVAYRVGFRHPLSTGASGLAILAGRAPRPAERAEVARARERGYAVSEGEIQPGAVGLAAPILAAGRPAEASVAVIALGALDEAAVAPRVVAAARRIAEAVG